MADKVFTTRNFKAERRSIPLPIQTYFWRQTSQLLKPKLVRKNYESACVSFERVICGNRVQDLQPSLATAVKSIPRWHFIQSSVPYILQCCASLLSNRERIERLGNAERELLHTLHWILLEGPHTCCIVDIESLLYPLTIIEQFVHVLIPHVYSMRESDLTFRLETGIALWQPLWNHEKPAIVPFSAAVIIKDKESDDDNGNNSKSPPWCEGLGKLSDESEIYEEFSGSTFFDVAVLKCLSSTGWAEDGVVWALRYLTAYLKREFHIEGMDTQNDVNIDDITVNVSSTGRPSMPVHPPERFEGTSEIDAPKAVSPSSGNISALVPLDSGPAGDAISKQEDTESEGCRELKSNIDVTGDPKSNADGSAQLQVGLRTDTNGNVASNTGMASLSKSNRSGNLLELPSSNTVERNFDKDLDEQDTSKNDEKHEKGDAAPTIERTGSTRLRIRVQSSPVMSKVGRVFAAVASPPDHASSQDSQCNLSDTGTFYNTKIFIRPAGTLHPVTNIMSDANKSVGDRQTVVGIPGQADLSGCKGNRDGHEATCSAERQQKQDLEPGPVDTSTYTGQPKSQEIFEPDHPSLEDNHNSAEMLERVVSQGSDRNSQIGATQGDIPGDQKEFTKQTQLSKLLSEQTSSSLPSTSSIDSEKRVVDFLPKWTGQASKPATSLGSLDSSRNSTNRDSFMRTERYFVVPGAGEHITTDGRLSALRILQALNTVMQENPTPRICDATLTVLQLLVTVHQRKKARKRGSCADVDDRTVAEAQAVGFRSPHSENVLGRLRASFYGRPPNFLNLAVVCLVKLVKALGCPLGCGEGCHGTDGDRLRQQASSLLSQIFHFDQASFKMWLQHFARIEPPEDLVDFLHALVGFCEDGKDLSDDEIDVKPTEEKNKGLFFIPEGINGVIIGTIFKVLLTRVAEMNFYDLTTLTFYGELRRFLKFVKDSYGGVFWKVALSGLLDSAFKESKEPEGNKTPEQEALSRSVTKVLRKDKAVERTATYKTKRKFLQKFARVTESSDGNGASNSSSFGSHRAMAVVEASSAELALSPRSKRKIFTLGTWRKQKTLGAAYDSDDDLLDASESPSDQQVSSARRKLLKGKNLSRKKLDDIFPVKIHASNRKVEGFPGSTSETSVPIDIVVREYETKPVDVDALRSGMVRFRFLLNGCQPGSVPDPKIVASMLDLEAPPVSRACLLLECCLLVHKCNKGEWPHWLKGSYPSLAQRRGAFSPPSVNPFMFTQRRNITAMHEAGMLFHSWGVALGQKMEQVLAKRRRKILPSIREEEAKSGNKTNVEDLMEVEEDFLDEASLTDTVKTCPYPLMMIACQLLQEITAFLRESHSLYSVAKPITRPLQRLGGQRRPSIVSRKRSTIYGSEVQHHRFSMLLGGGAEVARKASVWSQTSLQTDMASSPSKSIHDPPVIKVSESDPSGHQVESEQEGRVVQRESADRPIGNRASLYFPRVSTQHTHSPKMARSLKRSMVGGEGESVRLRSKSTRCHAKHLSVDATGLEEEYESEEEDPHTRMPWLNSIIQLNSSTAFLCNHQGLCPINCHQRQTRSCTRMMKALRVVYSSMETDRRTGKGGAGLGSPHISAPQVGSVEKKPKKDEKDEEMLDYITSSIGSLTQCPFSVIAKAGTVIDAEHLEETLPVAWELLLDEDQQLVSSVAAVFLLSGVRLRDTVEKMLHKELVCTDANDRVKSLLRLEILWQSRYHSWPRLQEGARLILKVPPPKVDFTLPSPAVGVASTPPPDCPWDARLTLEEQQGQKQMDKKKIRDAAGEARKLQERSEYLMRAVSVSVEATVGVHVTEEDKEKYSRVDVLHYHLDGGDSDYSSEEDGAESQQIDAELWPQAISSAVPDVIRMMDDVMVDSNKLAVMEVARRFVWKCLIDDPVLFFRIILEQLTKKDKQEEHISLLRKLLLYITELPPTASRFLCNNLIGVAMFYARTNKAGTQDSVALVLSLLWQLTPSVRGFLFKDLKQCLRKEHCDNALRISSNVPGAKKLCVILPDEVNDTGEEQDQEKTKETVPVHDEMTFGKVLESFRTRLKDLGNGKELYLLDKKSDEIIEEKFHVRDVFTHRKGFPSPLLLLKYLDPELAFNKRQGQAFTAKISEIGRVLLTLSVLEALPNQKHISFLHGEFSRQISFPRKALDCDFALYAGGTKGKELAALDVIHKSVWVKLITSLFEYMSTDFPWASADLHLFLNVINGAILLHCEDSAMLRLCLASFINIAVHFSHIFASNGYQYIFPSLLQVYSHHQSNQMVTTAIEFTMKQFYALHQKPCLLQLFASVAPVLLPQTRTSEEEEETEVEDLAGKIPPKCLFALLMSLDKPSPDSLEVLDLVRAEKPLKPVDSCYESSTDPPGESQIDTAVRLCVTVVNFAPESKRAVQMVVVLSAILPHYLEALKTDSSTGENDEKVKRELAALTSLTTSINVLVKSSEVLTRSFVHFQSYKAFSDKSGIFPDLASTTSLMFGRGSISSNDAPSLGDEGEWGRGRPFLERLRAQEEKDEIMQALDVYRKPRDALLILVSDYIRYCTPRLEELRETFLPRQSGPELLDSISINTLAQVVYSLLKLAVYDHVTLCSVGVQRYITDVFPVMNGPPDALETATALVVKRVNKMFEKFVNKPDLMRGIDWKSLEVYLKGLYVTLCKRPSIANSPYLKNLVTICTSLVLQERAAAAVSVAANLPFAPVLSPPQFFADTVIKLASRLIYVIRDQCSMRELCGGTTNLGSPSRTGKIFVRIILPICIRLGSGRSDAPRGSPEDVSYALSCFLRIITSKNNATPDSSVLRLSLIDDDDEPRWLSFGTPYPSKSAPEEIPENLYCAAYLGIKVLMVCFEDHLSSEWYRIYQAIETVVDSNIGNIGFWDFMNFCVSYRTPLFLLMMPLIRTKVIHIGHATRIERALKQRVMSKLTRPPLVVNCRNALISRFLDELAAIKAKRPVTVLQEEEEEENEGECSMDDTKALVLQPPPPRKDRIPSPQEEPAPITLAPAENKPAEKMTRASSVKAKKSVTFSPAPSFDDDQSLNSDSSLTDPQSAQDKRRMRRLRKQESFDAVEEQESQTTNSLLDVDSASGPFGHQRNATVRGKTLAAGRARRRFQKVRTVTSVLMSEKKTSNTSVEMPIDEENNSPEILEGSGELIEMQVVKEKTSTATSVVEVVSGRWESQSEVTPPIAKPESVGITISPHQSPSRLSPVQNTDDQYPDVLEAIKPVPPVKFSPPSGDKHEPAGATNGSVVPESKLSADYDVERAQRLSRTRWWHRMYTSIEVISSEDCSHRIPGRDFLENTEDQRESNV